MEDKSEAEVYGSSHKRMAKNTVLLYFRQMLIMAVSLYTSRVILNALGVADYGVYTVVGGFVAMFSVISGAFSVAITRFMAYTHGSSGINEMQKCYSVALIIQSALGMVVCLILSTAGVWYVVNIMVLPEGRTGAALWVLLFSAVSFFVSLISIPYNAMIIAHEHMQAFAYIGMAEAALKLVVALLVRFSSWDKLIVYSFLMFLSALIVRMFYAIYCKRHFEECSFSWHFDKRLLKEMMAFVGWAFLGNGAVVLKNQGINMIMNLFGGTVVNAARGISSSINNAVQSFTNSYIQAMQPQITQLYASDNEESMTGLIYCSCRYAYYLMLILCLPMLKNIEYVLQIWLGQVPEYVVSFATFTLLESLVQSLANPLLYGILASGRIRTYEIVMSIIYLLTLPFSYILLRKSCPMITVYYITLSATVLVLLILVWQSAHTYGLSYRKFIQKVLLRIGIVSGISAGITHITEIHFGFPFVNFLVESGVSVCITGAVIFFLGMERGEQRALVRLIMRKVGLPR